MGTTILQSQSADGFFARGCQTTTMTLYNRPTIEHLQLTDNTQ